MNRLFQRNAALAIARPVSSTEFFRTTEVLTVTDLRVQFSIEKQLGAEPNTCVVRVTNLAERTRGELQRLPLQVRLDAGYDGELGRLFVGDVVRSDSRLEGVDWSTKLLLGDGARATKHARLARSFKAGTDARKVVGDLAKSMGLAMPTNVAEARALSAQFASGVNVNGLSSAEMSRILKPTGLDWSVQDGRLQVLASNEVRADQAVVVSVDTGMVGSPEYGTPEEAGKAPTLTVKMLLYPSLIPGGRIRVESRTVTGLFKVQRVRHEGDTHGDAWDSTIEAVPL